MKRILVPTDFSNTAENTLEYAAEMAREVKATIVLLHVYSVPLINSEIPAVAVTAAELEIAAKADLQKAKEALLKKHGDQLQVEYHCVMGLPVDAIARFSEEYPVDLIIIGMQGAGYLAEKIIGSIATSLIRKSACPVLVIDKGVKFRMVHRIALACDFIETWHRGVLAPMKTMAELFGSHIYILHVIPEAEPDPTISEAIAGIRLDHSLEGIAHSFHNVQGTDVVESINDFVSKHEIDMVVMIPRTHSLLNTLFHEPTTKRMAFHSHVPLLALHDAEP